MGRYEYHEIEGQDSIRLVILHRGVGLEPVTCDIITCDLDNAPDYEALSYTWADENDDKTLSQLIWCGLDKQQIEVTKNCEAALRQLRNQDDVRILWIDAVCINQMLVQEKNHQVSLMSRIYHCASRVVVYLGGSTVESDKFFDALNSGMFDQSSQPQGRESCFGRALFFRRWFTRLWVLQEIALARAATVVCGDKTTPWRRLAIFYTNMAQMPRSPDSTDVWFKYGTRGVQPIETLPDLFIASQYQKASDPRDRVFALLGIVEPDARVTIMPDYRETPLKVFYRLVIYFLKKFHILFPQGAFLIPRGTSRIHEQSMETKADQLRVSFRTGKFYYFQTSRKTKSVWTEPSWIEPSWIEPPRDQPSWIFNWAAGCRPGKPICISKDTGVDVPSMKIFSVAGQMLLNGFFDWKFENSSHLGSRDDVYEVAEGYVKISGSRRSRPYRLSDRKLDPKTANVVVLKVSDTSGMILVRDRDDPEHYYLLDGISYPRPHRDREHHSQDLPMESWLDKPRTYQII